MTGPHTSTPPRVEQSALGSALPDAPPNPPTRVGRPVHPRPHIQRTIDGDTVSHHLDLEPIATDLIRDIARITAADNRLVQLIVVGRANPYEYMPAGDRLERDRALRGLVDALAGYGALLVPLHEDDVQGLLEDAAEAITEVGPCDRDGCTVLAEDGDTRCMAHGRGTW